MAWKMPRTDWESADYFNASDYNRIIGNIAYLRDLGSRLYDEFEMDDMGGEKGYSDYLYADEINAIETNLVALCENTYPFVIGSQKTYYPNQPTPDYTEFNRIEAACLLFYNNLSGQLAGKRRLAFILGGDAL